MSLPDGSASIWVVATRISVLDSSGYVDPGANTYTTTTLVKATLSPVLMTGDDIEVKNASGDLGAWGKHPDVRKYYTVSLELATPDPGLEAACSGGVLYTDNSTAMGTPTGATVTAQTTLGTLAAGTYAYRVSQYNSYGESTATADTTASVASGTTGLVVITAPTFATGALGARVYGRIFGIEQLLGSVPNIGTQTTSAASGTGTVSSLSVTALTKSIPAGTTFQIAGDTNTPKITFTTTAFAEVGGSQILVSPSQSITTTIAAGNIVPCFVDTGALTPAGPIPQSDGTAGPGIVGYQEPALGVTGNPNGVAMEFWSKAQHGGYQATSQPYWHWLVPAVKGMHTMPRDLTNANTQTIMEGQAWENPNYGSGPDGSWNFDSSKVFQRRRVGTTVVPAASSAPVAVPATV